MSPSVAGERSRGAGAGKLALNSKIRWGPPGPGDGGSSTAIYPAIVRIQREYVYNAIGPHATVRAAMQHRAAAAARRQHELELTRVARGRRSTIASRISLTH